MRLSIDKRDPGFSHRAVGLKARIYLDGVEVKGCVTADEEESLIVRYQTQPGTDKLVVDEVQQAYKLETVRGKVRIELLSSDGSSLREPRVAVERDPETGAIHLYVYSRVRPRSSRRHIIPKEKLPLLPSKLEAMVGLLAAGTCEELVRDFGDYLEPIDCAKLAGERVRQLLDVEDRLLRAASSTH